MINGFKSNICASAIGGLTVKIIYCQHFVA